MLTARELMTEKPVTIRMTARIRKAVDILQALDIRHLPVVDEEGALIGMLSDRDLRALEVPYYLGGELAGKANAALEARVSTLMSGDVIAVDAEADAAEIIDLMLDNKIGAVPVVDGDGTLVGIVSYVDLLRKLSLEGAAE